ARLACVRAGLFPAKLSVPVGRRILALSPHPDDETIGAGGLLLAHAHCSEISVITIFAGDGGGLLQDPAIDEFPAGSDSYKSRLIEERRKELRAACARFSGRIVGALGLSDGQVPQYAEQTANQLLKLVKSVDPDVVVLPWFLDNHPDHRTAN